MSSLKENKNELPEPVLYPYSEVNYISVYPPFILTFPPFLVDFDFIIVKLAP
jgi:hypothetical protein